MWLGLQICSRATGDGPTHHRSGTSSPRVPVSNLGARVALPMGLETALQLNERVVWHN